MADCLDGLLLLAVGRPEPSEPAHALSKLLRKERVCMVKENPR